LEYFCLIVKVLWFVEFFVFQPLVSSFVWNCFSVARLSTVFIATLDYCAVVHYTTTLTYLLTYLHFIALLRVFGNGMGIGITRRESYGNENNT